MALIALFIICCLLKIRRKQKLRLHSNAIAVATYETQQNYQAQVYQTQMNQAQIPTYQAQIQAQENQSQMNTPQIYSIKHIENPINSNNDVAYTSKAAEV